MNLRLKCCRFLLFYLPYIRWPEWTRRGEEEHMSQHSSLKGSGKITAKRNVLKRFERVNLLKKRGQWKDGDRGLGLRKTKPDA